MKIVLLISTFFSVVFGIYYIVVLSKDFYPKKKYFRLAYCVISAVMLNLFLIVKCWQLVFN